MKPLQELTMKLFSSLLDMNSFVVTHYDWMEFIDVKIISPEMDKRYDCTHYLLIYYAIN
jgi:hypothetical protein